MIRTQNNQIPPKANTVLYTGSSSCIVWLAIHQFICTCNVVEFHPLFNTPHPASPQESSNFIEGSLPNSLFCRLPSTVAASAHNRHRRSVPVVAIDNMLLALLALKSPCPESTGTTCKFPSESNKTLPILVLFQVFPSSQPTPPLHDQFCLIQLFVTIPINTL